MSAHVQGRVDALRDDPYCLQILRVVHLVAGVSDPAGRMHVHDVGEIDDFHYTIPGCSIQRRLIDHKNSCSARWAPSTSSPIKNHNRKVSARTRPRTICPRTMPTSDVASASNDGPATEVWICPAYASASASMIVETVKDSPSACTSLSRSNCKDWTYGVPGRSEEHTSELQSQFQLVCRLLL